MSVTWHTEGRIIYDCPQGIITIEMAQAASDVILALLDTQADAPPHSIHLVIDMRQVQDFPRNLSSATQTLTYMRHPALGWTLMITENQVQRIFASVLAQVFRVRFKMVATQEEALAFLRRYDATLAPLLPETEKPEE